jgi:hypothetical protein
VDGIDSRSQLFVNRDCARTSSCHLLRASLLVERYSVSFSGGETSFGTKMTARFESDSVAHLEEFGFAQFVRGCQYVSRRNAGRIENSREIFLPWRDDRNIPYYFPTWTIDGPSHDPISWSFESHPVSRHSDYLWGAAPASLARAVEWTFGERRPTTSALFVRDLPGTASYDPLSGEARNISLELRTCIFKSADVPRDVPADRVAFATPLHCFDWSSSWEHDHETGRMESPEGIVPFCR